MVKKELKLLPDRRTLTKRGPMSLSALLLVLAVVMFAIGAWSRWWASPQPYYPAFLSAGLFFWALSQLWPMINKTT
jgi:hypothetical protein